MAASSWIKLPYKLKTNEGINITVKQGSITDEKVDVIVNSTRSDLALDNGTLSKAILAAAGSDIQDECNQIAPNGVHKGEVVETSGGNLTANAIYHGSMAEWVDGNGEADLLSYIRCFLDKAHTDGKMSMAIPAIATGLLQFPHRIVAKVIYEEIVKFSKAVGTSTLKDIRIVVFDSNTTKEFREYFTEVEASGGAVVRASTINMPTNTNSDDEVYYDDIDDETEYDYVDPSSLSGTAAFNAGQLPTDQLDISTLFAYRTHGGISVHVKQGNLANEQCDAIVLPANTNLQMNQGAIANAILKGAGPQVQQECQTKAPNGAKYGEVIKTSGGKLKCKAIYHIPIKKCHKGRAETKLRDFMGVALQEAHQDGYQTVSFPSVGTGIILGYPSKDVSKFMLDELGEFTMREPVTSISRIHIVLYEKDHDTKKAFKDEVNAVTDIVARMNSLYVGTPDIAFPKQWTQMTDTQNVLLVNLPSSCQEYTDVSQRFLKSHNCTIQKISRVQSKHIYQMYALQKAQLEEQIDTSKFPVERTLYHGTPSGTMEPIMRQGFNRSYSGMNAAVYGNGTYFAKDASYSASDVYSPADKQGLKYMFQCRALTGEYTLGKSGIKAAPAKDASRPDVLFNSVVNDMANPAIFVIFTDFQAYPDYIISFKK